MAVDIFDIKMFMVTRVIKLLRSYYIFKTNKDINEVSIFFERNKSHSLIVSINVEEFQLGVIYLLAELLVFPPSCYELASFFPNLGPI